MRRSADISVIANILETLIMAGISADGDMTAASVAFFTKALKAEESDASVTVENLDRARRAGGAA